MYIFSIADRAFLRLKIYMYNIILNVIFSVSFASYSINSQCASDQGGGGAIWCSVLSNKCILETFERIPGKRLQYYWQVYPMVWLCRPNTCSSVDQFY
jgi:hypothetical protein